jgi:hypothetical protein
MTVPTKSPIADGDLVLPLVDPIVARPAESWNGPERTDKPGAQREVLTPGGQTVAGLAKQERRHASNAHEPLYRICLVLRGEVRVPERHLCSPFRSGS